MIEPDQRPTVPQPEDPEVTLAPERPDPAPLDARAPAGYIIERELGRGGMGVVYLARDTRLNRRCALKMILADVHAGDAQVRRFKDEAQAIARLQHPGIVQVYEIGEHIDPGSGAVLPFMALEYCAGGSLDAVLREHPLPVLQAAALVKDLAEAMQAAHKANVIHRDLKPANVLRVGERRDVSPLVQQEPAGLRRAARLEPRITDFGLARKLDETGATRTGAILGTPSYMPPEQAQGNRNIGPAADIYALGAILYECLTGRPPFRAATVMETLLQAIGEEPVPLRQLNASVPVDLETIAHKCLHKDPKKRYTTAQHLADDLRRFQAGEPIRARPVGMVERSLKWVWRNPIVAALLVFLATTCSALVLIIFIAQAAQRLAETRAGDLAIEKMVAEAARDEADRSLVESLLRPIGRNRTVDAQERDALARIAALPSDRLRLLLFRVGLSDPEIARRLGQRAAWIVPAAIGLSVERQEVARQILLQRLHAGDASIETKLACVRVGMELNLHEDEFIRSAFWSLVGAAHEIRDSRPMQEPDSAERLIEEVCEALPVEQAEEAAGVLIAVLAQMSVGRDPPSIFATGIRTLAGRLRPEAVDRLAGQAIALLQKADDPQSLQHYYLMDAIEALWDQLPPGRAEVRAQETAMALLTAIRTRKWDRMQEDRFVGARRIADPASRSLGTLERRLTELTERLPAEQRAAHTATVQAAVAEARKAGQDVPISPADEAISRLNAALEYRDISPAWQGLRPLLPQMNAEQSARAAHALLGAMTRARDRGMVDALAGVFGTALRQIDPAATTAVLLRYIDHIATADVLVEDFGSLQGLLLSRTAGQSRAQRAEIAAALVTALPRVLQNHVRQELTESLTRLMPLMTSAELVRLLGHPQATPMSNQVILAALGERCRQRFRSPWHFVEWARDNGVTFARE